VSFISVCCVEVVLCPVSEVRKRFASGWVGCEIDYWFWKYWTGRGMNGDRGMCGIREQIEKTAMEV
jgi:hypothetical protein